MGKRIQVPQAQAANNGFGERLCALRKVAGFTQVELAAELAISQRMVAYYEHPEATPPAHLLPAIAKALGVSIDDLYGRTPARKRLAKQEGDSRLRRRPLGHREARRDREAPGAAVARCIHRARAAQTQGGEPGLSAPSLDVVWDPAKAQSNLAKHGVSFAQAASVLLDPLALAVPRTAKPRSAGSRWARPATASYWQYHTRTSPPRRWK